MTISQTNSTFREGSICQCPHQISIHIYLNRRIFQLYPYLISCLFQHTITWITSQRRSIFSTVYHFININCTPVITKQINFCNIIVLSTIVSTEHQSRNGNLRLTSYFCLKEIIFPVTSSFCKNNPIILDG